MSKPNVQLVLATVSINSAIRTYTSNMPTEPSADYDDEKGFINRWRTVSVFKQVNFRQVLGGMFRTNQKYILRLERITFGLTSNLNVYATNEHNRACNIFMSGLPLASSWMNGRQCNDLLLGTVRVPSGAQVYTFYFPERDFTFELTGSNAQCRTDLRFVLRDTLLGSVEPVPVSCTTAIGNQTYQFSIKFLLSIQCIQWFWLHSILRS